MRSSDSSAPPPRTLCLAVVAALASLLIACGRATPTLALLPVTSEPDPLRGTRWQLVAFQSREAVPCFPDDPDLFVTFDEGMMRIRGGCNGPTAFYVLDGQRLRVTSSVLTTKDCPDLVVDQLELSLAAALWRSRSYTIDGNVLRIHLDGGELLSRRAPDG